MQANTPLCARLAREFNGLALLRAVILLLPFGVLALTTANLLWLQVSLLTIALTIPENRLALKPLAVLLHGMTMIACIYLLLFAERVPALFIVSCMLLAAGVIRIAAEGKKLRALGNWILIPVLILANELHGAYAAEIHLRQALGLLPYLLIALLPTLGVSVLMSCLAKARIGGPHWFSRLSDFGPKAPYGETMAAIVAGVGIAAALVEYGQMQNGQWVIWGVASVVTGAMDTARTKLYSRVIGVMGGVPLGIALGFVIPHSSISVTLATLATFLTLVAFHSYRVAYFFRCTLVALTIMVMNQSMMGAFQRITHVLLGGMIGMASVTVCHFIATTLSKHRVKGGTVKPNGKL